VNVTYTATLARTRRKRRPTVASEPQGCRPHRPRHRDVKGPGFSHVL